jgi:glutamate dehydrogenase/leucine dehydrogenase
MSNNKQETIEEAAERILSKEGVKQHPSGLETYLKGNVINAMVEMVEWQGERMYSEEEVLELLHDRMIYTLGSDYQRTTTNKWFEQFKKSNK